MQYFSTSSFFLRFYFSCLDFFLRLLPFRKRPFPEIINSVLFIKPDHLGDALLFTSVLPVVKKQYPHLKIDLLCGSWSLPIYKNNPYLSTLYTIDVPSENRAALPFYVKYFRFFSSFFCVFFALRKQRYDAIFSFRTFHLQFLLFSQFLSSKCVIGYGTRGLGALCDIEILFKKDQHETDYFFDMLAPLGIKKPDTCFSELYPSVKDADFVDSFLDSKGLKDKTFTVVCPGSGDLNRTNLISPVLWSKLIMKELLTCDYVVICGLRKDFSSFYSFYEFLPEALQHRILDFSDLFSISQQFLFLKHAFRIFCMESFLCHLSSLVSAPTVAFYGGEISTSDEYTRLIRFRPIRSDILCLLGVKVSSDYILSL